MKPSITPLLKKRLRLIKTISPDVFSNDIGGPYLSMWYTLKAQKTILVQFEEKTLEYRDGCPPLKEFIEHLDVLMDCPMIDLYEKAYDQLCELRVLLSDTSVTSALAPQLEICFKALLTITRRLYLISWEGQSALPLPQESPKGIPKPDFKLLESQKDVAVCRICDTPVKLSHFEAHTQFCVDTYRNQSKIDTINEDLQKIGNEIRAKLGEAKWGNIPMDAVMIQLPLLNAYLLTDRVARLSSTNPNASAECSEVMETLEIIMKIITDIKLSVMIGDLKERVNEKRHTAMAVMNAVNIMKQGTIGNRVSDKPLIASIAEFRFLKMISAGAYARVFLAEKESTSDIFAVKVLPRAEVKQKNQMERVMLEKNILLELDNKYIIKFFYAIVGKNNLYLVMEYLPGGDLYSLLNNVGCLAEDCTRVYMFQIALALSYLHSLGIIHRDLKPDNVLVTESGSLKLVDFGLSYKGLMHRTCEDSAAVCQAKSMVGTPDYISPEIVMHRPHTFTVDWWALGILIYECIAGTPPFHASTEIEIYTNIVKGLYSKPENVSPACIDIISRLLDPNPETRLGARGASEVLNHPWFAGLDEHNLLPPWIPEASKDDVKFFDCRYRFKSGDADVLEDIALAKGEQISLAAHTRSRSSSSVAGLMSPERLAKADNDDMQQFRAIALRPLIAANKAVLERARPIVQRDVGMPVSHSLGQLSAIGKREPPLERRRKSILSFGAQDDSVLSDMSCLSNGSGA